MNKLQIIIFEQKQYKLFFLKATISAANIEKKLLPTTLEVEVFLRSNRPSWDVQTVCEMRNQDADKIND